MGESLVDCLRAGACDGDEGSEDDLGAWLHKETVFDMFEVGRTRLSQFRLAGEHNAEVEKAGMQGLSLPVFVTADDSTHHTRAISEKCY